MRRLIRLTRRCAMAGAIAGLLTGFLVAQPATAAPTPSDPSTASLGTAQNQVHTAQEQFTAAEQEVREATNQLEQLSNEVVTLHNEQAQAQVAVDSARAQARIAIRSAYETATIDPTATLFADLSGHDPGLEDQVRDRRMSDLAARTGGLQVAADKLAAVSKDASARSVEAVKAAARAVGAASRARDALDAAEQNNLALHKAAELAAQRKELDQLSKELEASLASLDAGASGIGVTASAPADLIVLYKRGAATCPGLPWGVLAAIGQVETGHGKNKNVSSAGAMGPMQFMPATWKVYGIDGDGDGLADILDQTDAVFSAAHYLCANGGGDTATLYDAVFHYNHLDSYVRLVLNLAAQYEAGAQPS